MGWLERAMGLNLCDLVRECRLLCCIVLFLMQWLKVSMVLYRYIVWSVGLRRWNGLRKGQRYEEFTLL
jgi:hypothetical protein